MNLATAARYVNLANKVSTDQKIGEKRVQTLPKKMHKQLAVKAKVAGHDINKVLKHFNSMLQTLTDEEYKEWIIETL